VALGNKTSGAKAQLLTAAGGTTEVVP